MAGATSVTSTRVVGTNVGRMLMAAVTSVPFGVSVTLIDPVTGTITSAGSSSSWTSAATPSIGSLVHASVSPTAASTECRISPV